MPDQLDPLQHAEKGEPPEETVRHLLGLLAKPGPGLNETTKIEGKSNLVDGADRAGIWDMARDIASMANAPGGDGHFVYGVEEKTGSREDRPDRKTLDSASIADVLRQRCNPRPDFEYRECLVDGRTYGWLHVPKSSSQPHSWKENDGECSFLTRHGARMARATREELDEMYGVTVAAIQSLLAALGGERLPGATSPAEIMKVANWWLPADLGDHPQISWATGALVPGSPIHPILNIFNEFSDELTRGLQTLIAKVETTMSSDMFGSGRFETVMGEDYVRFARRKPRDGCPLADLRVHADGKLSYGRIIGNEQNSQIALVTLAIVPYALLEYARHFLEKYDGDALVGAYSLQITVKVSSMHRCLVDEQEYSIPELPSPIVVPSAPRVIRREELGDASQIAIQLGRVFQRIVRAAAS